MASRGRDSNACSDARNPHRNAPEYADRVNLIKKIKIGKEWRFAPVVPEANGRLKDKVRVNGQVELHTEGSYFIEWWVSGRQFRKATTREDAIECARHKSIELRAIRAGLIASPEPKPEAEAKTPIGDAIDDYLKYVKMQRKSRTFLTYRYTLDVLLRASYKRKYVEDATRQDAIDFMTYCYEQGLGARTVYDKVVTVLQLFKRHGREKLGKGRLAQLRRYHPRYLRAGGADGDVQGCDRR